MRRLVRIMWVPVLLAALYTGWVFWQRRTVPNRTPAQVDPMARYGSSVRILQLSARAGEISPGETTLLCYSVVNATALRLDPPVEKVWPSLSRCFEVTPAATTRYTLTAEDARHATVSESIEIVVKP